MWNICRSQCSTPRLFRPERVENPLAASRKRSSLFSSSWFATSLSPTAIRTAPNSAIQSQNNNNNNNNNTPHRNPKKSKNILDSSELFSIDSLVVTHPTDLIEAKTNSTKAVIYQQPAHLKDELSDVHQQITKPLSASMITLKSRDQAGDKKQAPIKMSSQESPSSNGPHKSNESEYKRAFIWNGSQPSVVREHPPSDHNIMSASQDSFLFGGHPNNNHNTIHNNDSIHRAPVQVGHGSGVLFSMERSIDLKTSPEPERVSEYHSKFKPFSDYVYVADEHRFRAQTPATKLASAAAEGANVTPAAKAWFTEVEERVQEACKYRARSQNGSTPIDPEWKGIRTKDRDFLALALATQITIAENRAQRASRSSSAKPTSRSSRKELNSAPASLVDAPAPVTRARPVKARTGTPTSKPASKPTSSSTDRNNNTVKPEAKVWIKPKKKDNDTVSKKTDIQNKTNQPKAVPRVAKKADSGSILDSEIKSVPLQTTQIKSPEELTGVKSPPPEAWKISIEKGNLQWVNNESPVNFDNNKNSDSAGILKPVAINGSKN